VGRRGEAEAACEPAVCRDGRGPAGDAGRHHAEYRGAVAAHGAALANIIFLARGAAVFEVFPFAYRAVVFSALASMLDLRYASAEAMPDTVRFVECVDQWKSKAGAGIDDGVVARFVRDFAKAAKLKVNGTDDHQMILGDGQNDVYASAFGLRACSRHQHLTFDVEQVAVKILKFAAEPCQGGFVASGGS